MPLTVNIDTSFVVPIIQYVSKPSKELLIEITNHNAAIRTHSHALRFRNTTKNISSFWKDILKQLSKKKDLTESVKDGLNFLYNETDTFNELLTDLLNYFPEGTNLRSVLYVILGYDLGIVSDGQALINIGHQDFRKDPQEILFTSIQELHHVVYTAYNPIFDLAQVHRTDQLFDVVKYCTHMEGLALHATLEKRRAAKAYHNRDYKLLYDEKAKTKRVSEYFDILTNLEIRSDSPLREEDWNILKRMSGRNRLWYVTGAHMAQVIEKNIGRETLVETMRLGPDDFFKTYHESF